MFTVQTEVPNINDFAAKVHKVKSLQQSIEYDKRGKHVPFVLKPEEGKNDKKEDNGKE